MNFKRVMGLIKSDYLRVKEGFVYGYIPFVVLASALLEFKLSPTYVNLFCLYAGGFLLTSYIFSDLHDVHQRQHYLTLPASCFEKLFSRWLMSGIGYVVCFLLLIDIPYAVGCIIKYFTSFDVYNTPGARDFLSKASPAILGYLVLHSIVLLGSVHFKKQVLLKTAAIMTICVSFLAALVLLIGYLLKLMGLECYFEVVLLSGYYLFWGLLAPVALATAYLRFKKYEI